MSVFLADMQFGAEGQQETLSVRTFHDGTTEVVAANGGHYESCPLTLGQTIQLRDFLNRHIDELALKQTGSLAQRADDATDQLAAVETVPVTKGCGKTMRTRNPQTGQVRNACCGDFLGVMRGQRLLCPPGCGMGTDK